MTTSEMAFETCTFQKAEICYKERTDNDRERERKRETSWKERKERGEYFHLLVSSASLYKDYSIIIPKATFFLKK